MRVQVTHTFDVHDDLSADALEWLVSTMTIQVEEPIVGRDEYDNDLTTDVDNIRVQVTPLY